jgi:hypothetical protein
MGASDSTDAACFTDQDGTKRKLGIFPEEYA